MSDIKQALINKFKTCRIVFWYDKAEELIKEYEEIDIPKVEKIHVNDNEFTVKYRISKEEVNTKFLLYFGHQKPANEENWMLDLELAHYIFNTNQEAMYMQEIGMAIHFQELVSDHLEFFKEKERRDKLKLLLNKEGKTYGEDDIRNKMLAILFKTDFVMLSSFVQAYSSDFIDGDNILEENLINYNLKDYFWSKIKHEYNYMNTSPGIYDFLLEVFRSNFSLGESKLPKKLNSESRILLLQWKDTILFKDSFDKVSARIAVDLDVESKLNTAPLASIINDNLFRLSDFKIIHDLVNEVCEDRISIKKLDELIKKRENTFWHNEFISLYNCISYGCKFIVKARENAGLENSSFEQGVKDYSEHLYEVDFMYRKFIWNYRQTKQNRIIEKLVERVEKIYANDWLLKYNNNWQGVINKMQSWPIVSMNSQRRFFKTHVDPFIRNKQKLFVIVSDALRYECGVELNARLQREKRYQSSIDHMVSSLPSYTQLGMASLLPHSEIAFKKDSDSIEVDGMMSNGIAGRTRILDSNLQLRSTAINASELMSMNTGAEGRDFVKQHDLIYIYHNGIDKTGDDKTTEDKTFDAVEEEINYLTDIVRKIFTMNGNNILITADHGFIYQNNKLAESNFIESNYSGDIWKESRRYVIGNNIIGDKMTTAFTSQQLGLKPGADVLIPKSIGRLRVKGAGSRFVHGGASLQEIVIPLIKVTKTRSDTVTQVNIDIIKSTDRITTNILPVSFMQKNLVGEKVLPRTIRAGIYSEDGEDMLSDRFKYTFDITEGTDREREVKHRFQLKSHASEKYKNKRVILKLEEPVEGTSQWKNYEEYYYTLNISFTNDFDGF